MGEIFVHDFSVLGGRSGNSVKRGSYRHTAYVCFDKRLLLAKVLRWVSQFWGKQYTCSGKYSEKQYVQQKTFKNTYLRLCFSNFDVVKLWSRSTIKTGHNFCRWTDTWNSWSTWNFFFSDNWSQSFVSLVRVPSPPLQNECKCDQD